MDILPPKMSNVLTLIRQRARFGAFVVLPHAAFRREERKVSIPDIIFVLLHGSREPEKDEYKANFNSWNYAMRGSDVDGRQLRVAVAFDKSEMLIVTVIPLGKRRA